MYEGAGSRNGEEAVALVEDVQNASGQQVRTGIQDLLSVIVKNRARSTGICLVERSRPEKCTVALCLPPETTSWLGVVPALRLWGEFLVWCNNVDTDIFSLCLRSLIQM